MEKGQRRATTREASSTANDINMKLIPWSDIWLSLKAAKCRGHGQMIEVFYDTLFKEATFDDKGAWSLRPRR